MSAHLYAPRIRKIVKTCLIEKILRFENLLSSSFSPHLNLVELEVNCGISFTMTKFSNSSNFFNNIDFIFLLIFF